MSSIPTCPQCGANVHRTHRCRVSGLRLGLNGQLPERGETLPAASPLRLVPMPEGWREQALAHVDDVDELDALLRRDAMHAVDLIDLANAEAERTEATLENVRPLVTVPPCCRCCEAADERGELDHPLHQGCPYPRCDYCQGEQ